MFASACGLPAGPTPSGSTTKAITVYDAGSPGVSLPTVLKEVKPAYTAEAIRNRIQGTVLLAVVVLWTDPSVR